MSEVGWLRRDQLLVTINNQLYMINLSQSRTDNAKKIDISFGTQQLNMNQFATFASNSEKHNELEIKRQDTMKTVVFGTVDLI